MTPWVVGVQSNEQSAVKRRIGEMRKIEAVIKPFKLDEVKEALASILPGMALARLIRIAGFEIEGKIIPRNDTRAYRWRNV